MLRSWNNLSQLTAFAKRNGLTAGKWIKLTQAKL